MNPINRIWTILASMCLWLAAGPLSAGVVVVQNWTTAKISFTARGSDGQQTRYVLIPTDIAAIPSDGPVTLTLGESPNELTHEAAVNSVHYLGVREGKPELVHLRLPGIDDKPEAAAKQPSPGQAPAAQPRPAQAVAPVYKIPVAILVDNAELRSRAVWEKKLRKRLEDASDIFEHHCRVRFEVVAVGTWQ